MNSIDTTSMYDSIVVDPYSQKNLPELNLDNPIFVCYINVGGLSSQRAAEYISEIRNQFNYSNITVWIMASEHSKIECVYDGKKRDRDSELSDLIKIINSRVDILSNSNSFEDFKINIRDWRIDNIVNG